MTPSSLLRAGLSLKGVQRTVFSLVRGGLGNDGVRIAEKQKCENKFFCKRSLRLDHVRIELLGHVICRLLWK